MNNPLEDVSVVIPAFGVSPYLSRVVEAVLHQSIGVAEIIIVHSGPADPSEDLKAFGSTVRVIHREQRTWAGVARNIGVATVRTKWVAFLDSDCVPQPGWLKTLLAAALSEKPRFVVGSLGCESSGGYWGLCRWMLEASSVHPYMPDRAIEGGGSGNMLVPVSMFRQVGGFPENLPASEDVALASRLRQAGLMNWFSSSSEVRHFNISGFAHYRSHLFWHGKWGGICRRVFPMPGSSATRNPALTPFVWAARYLLTFYRVIKWGHGYRLAFVVFTPGILLGSIIWNLGFLVGLASRDSRMTHFATRGTDH